MDIAPGVQPQHQHIKVEKLDQIILESPDDLQKQQSASFNTVNQSVANPEQKSMIKLQSMTNNSMLNINNSS